MIWMLAALPAVVLAAYFIHSGFKYTRMISHIFMSLVYRPQPESFPQEIPVERVSILDSGGREIEALTAGPKQARRVVLFCHESGADKGSWEKYAGFLVERGLAVIAMDLSPEQTDPEKNPLSQWPAEAEVARVLTVLRWAKRAYGPDARFILFGVSNGADLALGASTRDASVSAVVADGLFSMREIFRDYIRKWAPILVRPNLFGEKYPDWVVSIFADLGFWYSQRRSGKRFVDVERIMRSAHPPMLLVYGSLDDYIPPTHQTFLGRIGRSTQRADIFIVERARHNEAVTVSPGAYEHAVMDFIEREAR